VGYSSGLQPTQKVNPCNDKQDMHRNKVICQELKNNPYIQLITAEGKKHGLTLSVEYSFQIDKIIIFGRNNDGVIWEFLRVENFDKSYRSLDARTLNMVKEILYYNRSLKARKEFFKEIQERRLDNKIKASKEASDDLLLAYRAGRSTFKKLSRLLGYSQGKVNIPHVPGV